MKDADDEDLARILARPVLVRWLDDGSTFVLTRTILLRLLGAVYFVAYLATYREGPALIGAHGLLPAVSDGTLRGAMLGGMVLAALDVAGATNALVLLALWCIQLWLHGHGQIFWAYGWEMQLLETGMLAVFLCPFRSLGWRGHAPVATVWLLRWLIARIMLGAGLIKLRGDPCWRDLTCLDAFYETQPIPSPFSWVLHQLPHSVHAAGVVVNHVVELVVPFLLLGPRPVRRAAGVVLVLFQVFLIAGGNLSFLNWLTIIPAIACLDDGFWRFRPGPARPVGRWHRRLALGYAAIVACLSVAPVANLLSAHQAMNASFDPLHLVNTYGAFGSVSTVRNEIVLEGTDALTIEPGTVWRAYELPCKPGALARRPCLVAPYQHRLDWQMWFAAMESYDDEPWIVVLVDKLLRGDRAVTPLLATDPFPDAPPRFVRARLYRYRFTRRGEPGWWARTLADEPEYLRPLAVGDPELHAFLARHRSW